MTTFAVRYHYGPDTAAHRDEVRPEHVEFLRSAFESGRLQLSGPVESDSHSGALLIWQAASASELAQWLDGDPFYVAGIITEREILTYKPVFGADKLASAEVG